MMDTYEIQNLTYHVTGRYYNSTKRFSMVYSNLFYAMSINIWNGSVWEVRAGKRKLIKRVCN